LSLLEVSFAGVCYESLLEVSFVGFLVPQRHKALTQETCINQNRPTKDQRDLYTSKETYTAAPAPQGTHTRDLYKSKETHQRPKRPRYIKRDLYKSKETYINQKRPTRDQRDLYASKETCTAAPAPQNYVRRHTHTRDLNKSKETH